MDIENRGSLTFIGTADFGIKTEHVEEAAATVRHNIVLISGLSENEDFKQIEGARPLSYWQQVQVILDDPEEAVRKARAVYDRVKDLALRGTGRKNIAQIVLEETPEASLYKPLLETQNWGRKLNRSLEAVRKKNRPK